MHLRTIVLKGFKSFPDRTRLEFAPGVSVIVGPNGSGKSNVTDAVLWALGEQSPLAVRGQSMQDVIFAGAHGVQARSEAEVEVLLDNGDGAIDLPLSEISIVRRLNRAGEGEYRVNGARCRLSDVLELLSDTGLGSEMHSIVSQGRVAEIVTSRPRERRLLIEEAAGLGKHRRRRRRAQLKLDRTQDNLDRALDVEREARTRLRPLKRQAEAAELHARLERQSDEARWTLARDSARATGAALHGAEAAATAARAAAAATEAELARGRHAPRGRRARAGGAQRRARAARRPLPRHPLRARAHRAPAREPPAGRCTTLAERAGRRRALLTALAADAEADGGDDGRRRARRRPRGRARAAGPGPHGAARPGAGRARGSGAPPRPPRPSAWARRPSARAPRAARPTRAAEAARAARRECERAAEAARREAARLGAELAKVNQFLRAQAGAPGRRARRWPTRCAPSRATSWRWPRRSARACAPRWPATSPRPSGCSTARAATAAPRWWRPPSRRRGRRRRPAAPPAPGRDPARRPRHRRRAAAPRRGSRTRCCATSGSSTRRRAGRGLRAASR